MDEKSYLISPNSILRKTKSSGYMAYVKGKPFIWEVNLTGADLLKLLKVKRTSTYLICTLAKKYNLKPEEIKSDVLDFLRIYVMEGLLYIV